MSSDKYDMIANYLKVHGVTAEELEEDLGGPAQIYDITRQFGISEEDAVEYLQRFVEIELYGKL